MFILLRCFTFDEPLYMRLRKPVRPFKKDLSDALTKYTPYSYKNNGKYLYPCKECLGKGYFYDPNEYPDPIEGYKCVTKIKCKECGGKGFSNKISDRKCFEEWQKKKIAEYLSEVKKYRNEKKILLQIKKKLNTEEIEVLRKYSYPLL